MAAVIGRKEIEAAFDDVAASGDNEELIGPSYEAAGIDYDAIRSFARMAAFTMSFNSDLSPQASLAAAFGEGFLMGVRAGRADAVKLAEEIARG